MTTDALYYPLIDPSSKTMLINSLLYWDHLYTIVPTTVESPFQNQWSKAAHQYGFLKARLVDPWCSEVYRASDGFAHDLEREAVQAGVRRAEEQAKRADAAGYPIYPGKLSHRLLPANLTPAWRKRIWTDDRPDENGCLRMHWGYALAYMARLASVIAESDNVTCYTNETWSRDVVLDRYADSMKEDRVSKNEARLAALSINTIRIRSHVSIADVIRFRERNTTNSSDTAKQSMTLHFG